MSKPEGHHQPHRDQSDKDQGFPPDLNTTEDHAYTFYQPPDPTIPPAPPGRQTRPTSAVCGLNPPERKAEEITTIYRELGHRTRIVPPFPGEQVRSEPAQETLWKFADEAMPDWFARPGVPILITVVVAVVAGFVGLIVVLATL